MGRIQLEKSNHGQSSLALSLIQLMQSQFNSEVALEVIGKN
jgi:hypothetical protein